MARRLLDERRRDSPTIAILGAAHVVRKPMGGLEPVGLLVEQKLPGVANGFLAPLSAIDEGFTTADVSIPIGEAEPAVRPSASP
jgi:hypothetical protein